jgi:CRP-like cAMP-binding protein
MIKGYLVVEEGLAKEKVFFLEERLTIGRGRNNDVKLLDPSVSRNHAVVFRIGPHVLVEDLGSRNGTFVNGERVRKSLLAHGDRLRVGNMTMRFYQQEISPKERGELTTRDLESTKEGREPSTEREASLRPSRRVLEALSRVPLFQSMDEALLRRVGANCRLVVYKKGSTIVQEGERDRSMYIILDGKVQVSIRIPSGSEVPLAVLSANDFFGEISFLTGDPRSATVKAMEETLVAKLTREAMEEILASHPSLREMLEEFRLRRLEEIRARRRALGLEERRRHPRYRVGLLVRLWVAPQQSVSGQFQSRVFQGRTVDVSVTGVRIAVSDPSVVGLPPGCRLRLEMALPEPWGAIRSLGVLRNVIDGKDQEKGVHLGVEYMEMAPKDRKKLEEFLRGGLRR